MSTFCFESASSLCGLATWLEGREWGPPSMACLEGWLWSHLSFLASSFLICKIQVLDEKVFTNLFTVVSPVYLICWLDYSRRVFLFPDRLCILFLCDTRPSSSFG